MLPLCQMAHLRAIITGSTPFLTFYKFRDNMILEELTLGPNTLVPSSQPFYSNNTLAPPPLAQFHPLVMVARVKDRVVIVAATVARAVEAMTAVATTTLLTKATGVKASRIRTASLVLHRLLNPPSAIIGLGPSTCTLLRLRGGGAVATLPSAAAGSRCCAWPDYGRLIVHTTLGADPASATDVCRPAAAGHISILDALAQFLGLAVTGQLL
jgi:hypothetical protein